MKNRDIDEHLEILWHLFETDELTINKLKEHMRNEFDTGVVEQLELQGHILTNNGRIELREPGWNRARMIIRCHRLAERLQFDVLGMKPEETESGACEFEHLIAPEIADSICTLLGHPRECPHGRPIPEGQCCQEKKATLPSAVMPLDQAEMAQEYRVAYVCTPSHSRMHKFSHFGIVPGSRIILHQCYPAFVIRSESGQLALERDLAREIYVWKNGDRNEEDFLQDRESSTHSQPRGRFGHGRFGHGRFGHGRSGSGSANHHRRRGRS